MEKWLTGLVRCVCVCEIYSNVAGEVGTRYTPKHRLNKK